MKNVVVTNNAGMDYGGGAAIKFSSNVLITGGTFAGNISNRGGGLWLDTTQGTIEGVTITGNAAIQDGGGVNASSSMFTLKKDLIFGNTATTGPDYTGGITFM